MESTNTASVCNRKTKANNGQFLYSKVIKLTYTKMFQLTCYININAPG